MSNEPNTDIRNTAAPDAAKPQGKKPAKRRFSGDHYGRGTVSVGMILIVIAVVIVLNLIVGQLPSNVLQADISPAKLYEISDTTKDFLSGMNDHIELIMVDQESKIDDRIYKFVNTYAEQSDKITVSQVDPVATPSVLTTYNCEASTLVVLDTDTGKNYNVKFYGTSDAIILYTLNSDQSQYEESAWDGDGQITAAINNLTTEATDTVYYLSGHNEQTLPDDIKASVGKLNVNYAEDSLDLLKTGIPDDCSMIICYDPSYDLADDEYTLLADYLAKGGDVLIITQQTGLANFNKLMKVYGIEMQDGYLGDQMQYYSQYYNLYQYYCFYPNISSELDITSGINTDIMLLYAKGMLMTDPERSSIINNRFLWTTNYGFLESSSDTQQSYSVGIQAYEDVTKDDGTTERANLTVISCVAMFSDSIIGTFPNKGNAKVLENAIAKSLGTVNSISIPTKSMSYTMNTMSNVGLWSLLFIGVIPVGIFVGGLCYWLKRRKK